MQIVPSVDTETQKLLTVRQAGSRLGCSPWTVYRRIHEGAIPFVRLGYGPKAPIRIDEGELRRFVYGSEEPDDAEG